MSTEPALASPSTAKPSSPVVLLSIVLPANSATVFPLTKTSPASPSPLELDEIRVASSNTASVSDSIVILPAFPAGVLPLGLSPPEDVLVIMPLTTSRPPTSIVTSPATP